jgi:histidinol-phosphatase
VALEHEGIVVAGAIGLPAFGELYWAGRGLGAYRDDVRLRVSEVDNLAEATLSLGEPSCLLEPPYDVAVRRLVRATATTRAHGDLYACTLILNGRAEIWLEAGVHIWDIAPLQILVEEAGGRFTDFDGVATVASGHAVATNGVLHETALAYFRASAHMD